MSYGFLIANHVYVHTVFCSWLRHIGWCQLVCHSSMSMFHRVCEVHFFKPLTNGFCRAMPYSANTCHVLLTRSSVAWCHIEFSSNHVYVHTVLCSWLHHVGWCQLVCHSSMSMVHRVCDVHFFKPLTDGFYRAMPYSLVTHVILGCLSLARRHIEFSSNHVYFHTVFCSWLHHIGWCQLVYHSSMSMFHRVCEVHFFKPLTNGFYRAMPYSANTCHVLSTRSSVAWCHIKLSSNHVYVHTVLCSWLHHVGWCQLVCHSSMSMLHRVCDVHFFKPLTDGFHRAMPYSLVTHVIIGCLSLAWRPIEFSSNHVYFHTVFCSWLHHIGWCQLVCHSSMSMFHRVCEVHFFKPLTDGFYRAMPYSLVTHVILGCLSLAWRHIEFSSNHFYFHTVLCSWLHHIAWCQLVCHSSMSMFHRVCEVHFFKPLAFDPVVPQSSLDPLWAQFFLFN